MSKKKDANTLLEITAALSIWRDAGPDGPKQFEDVHKAAAKAMKLLRDNADLLHRCENAYKVNNRKAKTSLVKLNWMLDSTDNQDPEFITKRIGSCDYQDFAQDAFMNELNHWAKKLAATTKEHKEKTKAIGSINIQNSNVILGDVQAKNLQIGDNACIDKQSVPEKPAGTGQKEIVEVKPGLFGITVDIKELAKRFRKWVCSRRKD